MNGQRFMRQAGATLVEVLVAIALTGIMLPALVTGLVTSQRSRPASSQQVQAQGLLREATAAVRSVREKGWTNVSTDGTYHPVISGGAWTLAAGSEAIGNFTRQIVISTPQRNSSDTIVVVGGTNDPNTKHVVVTVSWNTPYADSVSTNTFLTRWRNNAVWSQTTQADFTGGTFTNTCATSTCDSTPPTNGVQLQDLPATWQLPSILGNYNVTGNVSGLSVSEATINSVPYAFVGYATGMAIVNVSNPAAPTLTGTFATSAAVNGIYVSGTTAYLATAITNAQFKIVNIVNPAAPTQVGTMQVGDTAAATAVTVSGTFAYVVKNAASGNNGEFNIINITTPSAPTLSGKMSRISANMTGVAVSGNFAFVSTAGTNRQLQVVNITTKTAPTSAATVSLGVTANGISLSGTTAYIATANNTTSGELRIYDVTTPTAPASLGSYEVGGNVAAVSQDSTNPDYVLLATAITGKQVIVVNVASPATPTLVNNVSTGNTTNAVFASGSYAYLGTANTSQELQVLYTGYRPNGTFESSTFDAGANAGLNYLTFTTTVPAGTTLTFQVAANNTGTGWSYIGPDGTAGTSYSAPSASGSIPLSIASNRYFRYKATFTPSSNGQLTPLINDVTLNYSP